jgi:hypothetical protein
VGVGAPQPGLPCSPCVRHAPLHLHAASAGYVALSDLLTTMILNTTNNNTSIESNRIESIDIQHMHIHIYMDSLHVTRPEQGRPVRCAALVQQGSVRWQARGGVEVDSALLSMHAFNQPPPSDSNAPS